MTTAVNWSNDAFTEFVENPDWRKSRAYRLHLAITRDDDNCYSAVVMNLPGAGSCGETEEEAIENAKESVRAVLESYEASQTQVPWKDTHCKDIPPGVKQKWVILNG